MPTVALKNYKKIKNLAGRPLGLVILWELVSCLTLRNRLCACNFLKKWVLRLFGSAIGPGVVIKQQVAVKYPWKLTVGADTWLGEGVWIDNIALVSISHDVCLSQGAYVCTGNHDWSQPDFPLSARPVVIEEGVWVGARAIITGGLKLGSHSVITAGSVVVQDTGAYQIVQGNPAVFIKNRTIQ